LVYTFSADLSDILQSTKENLNNSAGYVGATDGDIPDDNSRHSDALKKLMSSLLR